MRFKTIHVNYSRKFNLGNFQSAALECGAWAEIEEAEDPGPAAAQLRAFCREQVQAEYRRIDKSRRDEEGS